MIREQAMANHENVKFEFSCRPEHQNCEESRTAGADKGVLELPERAPERHHGTSKTE